MAVAVAAEKASSAVSANTGRLPTPAGLNAGIDPRPKSSPVASQHVCVTIAARPAVIAAMSAAAGAPILRRPAHRRERCAASV
jgi:hypothetical protein